MATSNNKTPDDWKRIVISQETASSFLNAHEEETEDLAYWAAFYGRLELLKWLKEERGVDLLPQRRFNSTGMGQRIPVDGSSDGGQVEVMEYFLEIGYKMEGSVQFRKAIQGGHLDYLKHFHFKGYDLTRDEFMSSDAARFGHMDIVKWLHEIGGAWGRWTCQHAAESGRLDILRYAHENGCDWTSPREEPLSYHIISCAAKGGNLDCLKYVYENSACELGEYAAMYAAEGGHLDCLKYLHQNGIEFTKIDIDNAAKQGINDACVRYIEENNQPRRRNLEKELHSAVSSGNVKMIRQLVQEGANMEVSFQEGLTPLRHALRSCKWEVISCLVELGANVNVTTKYSGKTALHIASLHGQIDLVSLLLSRGANIEASDDGKTPLAMACITGKLGVMNLLLDKGANMEARDNHGFTPIFHACESGQLEAVRLLLNRGANVNAVTSVGWTTLSWRLQNSGGRRDALIRLLLERGAKIDSKFFRMVCQKRDTVLLSHLLEEGADIHSQDKDGNTVAHNVTDSKVLDILLKREPSLLHATNNEGQNLLFSAQSTGVIHYLLDRGLDIDGRDKAGRSPLHWYIENSIENNFRTDAVLELLRLGAMVNAVDNQAQTPLHLACSKLNEKLVRLLLDHGANINQQNAHGNTPLLVTCMYLSKSYHISIVQLLLDRGADITMRNATGQTVLHVGCTGRKDNFFELLLKHGADVNTRDSSGATALVLASRHSKRLNAKKVSLLLKYGADQSIPDREGRVPIHIACEVDAHQACRCLIKHSRTYLSIQDTLGRTPLHIVCENGFLDLARFLVEEGASDEVRDHNGNTPLHSACFSGHWDIAVFLLRRCGSALISVANNAGKLAVHGIFLHDDAPLDVLFYAVREVCGRIEL
mmetsp:Transcript_25912/g.45686  ORF Transcript_25912/g.45686 Transcript_25912/m.45686 type:complete len:878 (-) Transcript_25912:91-2724(-)|eukprot:CAMPEP_0178885294 /NCGR_PEP_ID=MMETSP0747-20121128/15282_1 /TAXON_ID=913974 /ORGANISM="Nitzschia punctata, Strain CCMP561" /LENGTH=877 /DNA_ID=CAMNT_0020553969 /DNA_START=18 /DNA_END=2651 /DNA_ORIENTATION=+